MDVDFSELNKLAADLQKAPESVGPLARKAVEVTARKVKDSWRENAQGMAHAPAFPYSISYDIEGSFGQIDAEIGPDKGATQGALGNLIEFGSRNNAPQGLGHGALQDNEQDFVDGLQRAVDDSLREAGL